jgi:tRNA 2-thiouridine synthesizing protein B
MLHIINSAPAQSSALQSCLLRLTEGSAVLLIENGVYAGVESKDNQLLWNNLPGEVKCYLLESDLEARGLSKSEIDPRFIWVNYAGFVDLVEQQPSVQSWV